MRNRTIKKYNFHIIALLTMILLKYILCLIFLLFSVYADNTPILPLSERCKNFQPGLACSMCNEIQKLGIKDNEVYYQECKECCSTTTDLLLQREYSSAVIQVSNKFYCL